MLRLWLPLNGDPHNQGLDDVTSTTTGTVKWSNTGKIGKGFDINGGYVRYTVPSMVGTNIFSVSFWYKPISNESITANWNKILVFTTKKTDGTEGALFRFESSYNGGTSNTHAISVHNNVGEPIASVGHTLTGEWNKWHHIVAASDGTNMYTYCDNVLIRTSKCNGGTLAGSVYVGYSGTRPNGIMNDVRVYDHCLSTKEVKELSKGLVLHYPLNRGGFGQDNIIKNSSLRTNYDGWTKSGSLAAPEFTVKDGYECIHFTGELQKNASYAPCFTTNNTRYLGVQAAGNTYTLSFDVLFENVVKGTTNYYITFYKSGETVNGTWINPSVVSNSGHMTSATSDILDPSKLNGAGWQTIYLSIRFGDYNWSNANYLFSIYLRDFTGDVYIKNAKVETGLVHTPWLPNSADTLYSSMGLDDGIEYDVSGYQNNGTITGSLTCSSDTPRYMVSTYFNGGDNAITVPFNSVISDATIPFTINLWFKKSELGTDNYESLFGGPSGFEMDTRSGSATSLSLYMASPRGGVMYSPFNLNEWYMVTMASDRTNEYYYVNGELAKTITAKSMPVGSYFIGAWQGYNKQNYKGLISDFRIYSTCLSADDILALYHTPVSIANNGMLLTQGEISEV